YFRDRAKVRVSLRFDMQGFGGVPKNPAGYFLVTIYNVGRRPIYLSHAHLTIAKRASKRLKILMLADGLEGVTIPEGGAPHPVLTKQDDLNRYPDIWPYIRAVVIDTAGRSYYSDWPTVKPEWAGDHPYRFRVFTNKVRNRIRRLRP